MCPMEKAFLAVLATVRERAAEAMPLPQAWIKMMGRVDAPAALGVRVGGKNVLADADLSPPLAQASTCTSTADVWADIQTTGNIVKTTRALKLHLLKLSANSSSCMFFGPGLRTMSTVFSLKKFPTCRKALQIPHLPQPLVQPVEGLFLKTSSGKRILSVPFGHGDMEEAALVQNAVCITTAVRKGLDVHLVHDVSVVVDKLELPIWNRKLWDNPRSKSSAKSSVKESARNASMEPPVGGPRKKARLEAPG